ncbi:MAG: hypothetical protein L6R28_19100, partial [Planctomycetes bacterium]|nr:hypothetical protein [Planctomycetota bacterium]
RAEHLAWVEARRASVGEKMRARKARVTRAFRNLETRLLSEQRELAERCRVELETFRNKIVEEEKRKRGLFQQEHEEVNAIILAMREKSTAMALRIVRLGRSVGLRLGLEDPPSQHIEPEMGDPRPLFQRLEAKHAELSKAVHDLEGGFFVTFGRRSAIALGLMAIAGGFGFWLKLLLDRKADFPELGLWAGSLAGALMIFFVLAKFVRGKASTAVFDLFQRANATVLLLAKQEESEKERFHNQSTALIDTRFQQVGPEEDRIKERTGGEKQRIELALSDVQQRYGSLKEDVDARGRRNAETVERAIAEAQKDLERRHAEERKKIEADHAAAKAGAEDARRSTVVLAEKTWSERLDEFSAYAKAAMDEASAGQQSWQALKTEDLRKIERFPEHVMIGKAELPLRSLRIGEEEAAKLPETTLTLPVCLSSPGCGSLLVQAETARRDEALQILFNTALRVLTSFPPGMARLTIIDPVGLGQAFSALMQLADYDEALIGGRIWTDAGHIEKRLAEMTEHMEKIIQKYLRNRYTTIGEYNKIAGEMKEAYNFVLLSDFPTGLSDLAMERLDSIVNAGAACGVHVLMHHDSRQKWPEKVNRAQMLRNGVVLKETKKGFTVDLEGLNRGRFVTETAPDAAAAGKLLEVVGKRAVEAKRVELSFKTVTPKEAEMWSRNTDKSFAVPIGRSGAVKLQEMELGKGTAQHALVAGRTGSGKSTLFHVIISNTALWYSPDEIELYLIDFKKGVEFKTFATHRLPHARVIAVESDREFGLSVLKRIDRELNERGERFRAAGVQDVAGFRKAEAGVKMPRTLLLIDEFQEFFTEDDTVAQEATLLLDRFVRQGRAFGLHLILGSQTLSGVYTLAKSTLGQMGVRIALQCNESDSYLILSEDNAAARLLSRPGEAIYNDMSGLVEGNNPFQIVWLPDDEESKHLKNVAARADREGRDSSRTTVVFEGNAPAHLEENQELAEQLDSERPEHGAVLPVWLGEPNAIKGPTQIQFNASGGSHVLMIGPRKDAAFGMMYSTILSLASYLPADAMRVLVFDGSAAEGEYDGPLARLAEAIPHEMKVVPYREIPECVEELDKQIKSAQEAGEAPKQHTFLFVFGLQRFRMLRNEDDFGVSSGDAASVGERFGNIVKEGPEQQVHAIVWSDTLANTSKAISRRAMREFDNRILFQMSASDSSELIDAPAANTLGLHNALLFVESDGLLEKFRPYALPGEHWLDGVKEKLQARFPSKARRVRFDA